MYTSMNTLGLISPLAQEQFKTDKCIFLIFQSMQCNWSHLEASQQPIHFLATWRFSYPRAHSFLASSLVQWMPGPLEGQYGVRGVPRHTTIPLLGGGGWVTVSVQLNQGRTLLLPPKDSPLPGDFSQGQVSWQQQEPVPTCCETRAVIC